MTLLVVRVGGDGVRLWLRTFLYRQAVEWKHQSNAP